MRKTQSGEREPSRARNLCFRGRLTSAEFSQKPVRVRFSDFELKAGSRFCPAEEYPRQDKAG